MSQLERDPRLRWLAAAIVLGFIIRLYYGLSYFFHPDEVLHYTFAHQPTVRDAWLETGTQMHTYPPLYVMLLHGLLAFGNSEILLRAPALLLATLIPVVGYYWVRELLGADAALAAGVILALGPGVVSTGFEVRNYALFLAALVSSLYALEKAFATGSAAWIWRYAAALYVAILTNYTMAWIALALGIAVLARLFWLRQGRAILVPWMVAQAGAVAIYAWLYARHLRLLIGSGNESGLKRVFHSSYYWPESDFLLWFVPRQSTEVFRYAVGVQWLGVAGVLLFVAALVALWRREGRKAPVLLLAMPFAVGCAAAVAGLNPYGYSRHSAMFVPFAAAGVGWAVAFVIRRLQPRWRVAGGVGLAAVLLTGYSLPSELPRGDQRRTHMIAAAGDIRKLPPNALLTADVASSILLSYYLGRDSYGGYHERHHKDSLVYGGFEVQILGGGGWSLSAPYWAIAVHEELNHYWLAKRPIWAFAAEHPLIDDLPKVSATLQARHARTYGRLSLFEITRQDR